MSHAAQIASRDGLGARLRRFFYAEEVPFGLAMLRILIPLVLLYPMAPRWFHCREYYSTDGANTPLWIQFGFAHLLPEFSGSVAVALYTLMLLCFLTSIIGFQTRASLLGAFALYTYFSLVDSVSTMTKYSAIASHVLLMLSLSQCGAVWSLDAWLAGRWRRRARPGEAGMEWPKSPAWPRRLIQLMIGIVYFGASITKMHTPAYFSGDQLRYWMITDINFPNLLGDYVALYPPLIVIGCYVAVVFELLFLFLAWRGLGRRVMLTLGVLFHLGTFLTLGLRVFPTLCVMIYFAFLTEEDVRAWAAFGRRRLRRWGLFRPRRHEPARRPLAGIPEFLRLPAPAVFGLLALTAMLLGGVAEYRIDLYGERRAEGPYALRQLDTAQVQAMLAPSRPIRLDDKIFSFDLGTIRVGGTLANRRREFHPGEHLWAELTLSPPFEDMWVQCTLVDQKDRPLANVGNAVVTRDMLRAHFCYTFPRWMEPGQYWVVLSCAGHETERLPITIAGAARKAALAN
jgi:hypothetical protein